MTWRTHAAQGAICAAIASPYLTVRETAALFLSIVFIDVDHYFDFVAVCKRYSIRDMFRFHQYVWDHKYGVYGINVFHTFEVFGALFLLGWADRIFWVALAGFLAHMALDLISLWRNGILFNRAFSIIEYVIRKRNPATKGYPVPEEGFWE
ncbi:MAG: hypothetical protein HY894_08250 [Deltaproteobacteria bacterium]|nr:hypothetical protein [Deltaproteobacteria bacterium]